ncbi:hypothetical protein COOONC_27118 [Cooperia oncophora]
MRDLALPPTALPLLPSVVDFAYGFVSLEALYFIPLVVLIYVARTRLLLAKIVRSQ